MASHLQKYSEYQASGIPWLGQIPAHWEMRKLRHILTQRTERNRPDLPLLSVVREKGVILRDVKDHDTNPNYIPDDLSNYKVVRAGQFAMNKMKAWQGSYGVSAYDGVVSPAYFVFDLIGVSGTFFHLTIRSKAYVPFFTQASDGVRIGQWDLSQTRMREILFFIPPPGEQDAIVRFITHVDQRIRRYIRAKRQLIKLLEDQKQFIIQQAVTRGLDRNVATTRPDRKLITNAFNIPWLDSIPSHWQIVPAKRLFSVRNERAWPDDQQLSATQAYGVIPQRDFEQLVGRRVVKIFKNLDKRSHVEKDDFVISMRSFQGGLERAWARGCIRSSYVILKPGPFVDVDFFSYLFKSHGYIQALQASSNFIRDGQDLNLTNFCLVDLPLVPMEEQRAIARYIAAATAGIDDAIASIPREIELLNEYRTRLIADVVTGKLDVREAARKLPNLLDDDDDYDYEENSIEDDGFEEVEGDEPEEE